MSAIAKMTLLDATSEILEEAAYAQAPKDFQPKWRLTFDSVGWIFERWPSPNDHRISMDRWDEMEVHG